MPTSNIDHIYESYLRQVAAESYLERDVFYSGENLRAQLKIGANRKTNDNRINGGYSGYTRLTDSQIAEFDAKFRVIHQWSDDPTSGARPIADGIQNPAALANTGLSATLIQTKDGYGAPTNRYTLSIRSTEFQPWSKGGDAERDLKGADISEISFNGFALAQLDALERYYDWLKSTRRLPVGAELDVTGYSLGGHLATIFTEIHQNDRDIRFGQTVTFNGAGRGAWDSERGSLLTMLQFFRNTLENPDYAIVHGSENLDRSLFRNAKGAASSPFNALSVYGDARYVWAAHATFGSFKVENHAVRFFRDKLAGEFDGGTTDHWSMRRITQVFGFETIRNTNFTANSGIHGATVAVGIESQPFAEGLRWNPQQFMVDEFGNGHAITLLGDSLALQRAMHRLDSSFTLERFLPILEAATHRELNNFSGANYELDALENILDGLRRIIQSPQAVKTAAVEGVGGFGDWNARNLFHNNLESLIGSSSYAKLAGKVRIEASGGLQARAGSDFSAIASLLSMSPVVLVASTPANQAALDGALQATWGGLYGAWHADRSMTAGDRDAGSETFTGQWLADRSLLARAIGMRNLANSERVVADSGLPTDRVFDVRFVDSAGATQSLLAVGCTSGAADAAILVRPRRLLHFGADAAEVLNGAIDARESHLYGGAGNDSLNGGIGNDYLEGNAGDDSLRGAAGNDSLIGGAGRDSLIGDIGNDSLAGGPGDDSLDGGAGSDILNGGTGFDRYNLAANWGSETILDSDGLGTVVVDGLGPLNGNAAVKRADGVWQTADKRVRFGVALVDTARSDLLITFADRKDSIRIVDWKPGRLGITLGATAPLAPPASSPFVGDFVKRIGPDGKSYQMAPDGNYQNAGMLAGAADLITGSASADSISGLGGDDALLGRGGDDFIDGGAGNDVLQGGLGADTLIGGAGNDFIGGSSHGALTYPTTAGFSAPVPTRPFVLARGFNWFRESAGPDADGLHDTFISSTVHRDTQPGDAGNLVDAGAGQDFIVAGTGHDIVHGGDDADDIYGMAGNDILFGDGGNDRIAGDGSIRSKDLLYYTAAELNGADAIDGGLGNDSLLGQGGNDTVYGGAGNDKLWGDDRNTVDTSVLVNGEDHLDGGDGNDELVGGGRDDVLQGGAGDDLVWGDCGAGLSTVAAYFDGEFHGNDLLDGGDGNDYLQGEGGADTVFGASGNDTLYGDNDEDRLAASFHGNDLLDGGAGDDWLTGQGGNDTLRGGAGRDRLFGGRGDDLLNGGAGGDELRGGSGNDTYVIAASESRDAVFADTVTDDEGSDVIVLDGVDLDALGVTLDGDGTLSLLWGSNQGIHVGNGLQSSIQTLVVNSGEVTFASLVGSRLATRYFGTAERAGARLLGGAGEDLLTVKQASTRIHGGRGADIVALSTDQGAIIEMSPGDGTDDVRAVARSAPTVVGAPAPQNVLELGAGFVAAQARIYQTNASSWLLALNDSGDGISFSGASLAAAKPIDSIRFADKSALTWQQIASRGVVILPIATAGDDKLLLTPVGDSFNAGAGNDRIDGQAGNDFIVGGTGDDTLLGGRGDDQLFAQSGSDLLVGGEGNDSLYGGDLGSSDDLQGGEGDDAYFFQFGYYNAVDGIAADTSTGSNDVYHVRSSGSVGGDRQQTWKITDHGGWNDKLQFDSVMVDPATTTVHSTRGGFLLKSLNLAVELSNALDDFGNSAAGAIESISFANGTVWNEAHLRSLSLRSSSGNDEIAGFEGNDLIDGGAGADTVWGRGGNDTLRGGAGYDYLFGGAGNDSLDAGADGGSMSGDAGDDIYLLPASAANVSIRSSARGAIADLGFDILQIDARRSEVTVSYVAAPSDSPARHDEVIVRRLNGPVMATFTVSGTRRGVNDPVEQIRFADGATVDVGQFVTAAVAKPSVGNDLIRLSSIDSLLDAGAGNDTVYGRAGNDTISGSTGNDLIDGGAGDDHLDGGPGNDSISVGGGSNTVAFGIGSGNDTMGGGNGTTLQLGSGIAPGNLQIKWVDVDYLSRHHVQQTIVWPEATGNLRLIPGNGTDSLETTVDGYHPSNTALRFLRFSDGTIWDLEAVVAAANKPTAGADLIFNVSSVPLLSGGLGDDTLYGFDSGATLIGDQGNDLLVGGDANDRLIGGPGDDVINGGAGTNTFVYALGDGNDTHALAKGGRTRIEFAAGITPSALSLTHRDSNFMIAIAGQGMIGSNLVHYRNQMPTEFRFADGTIWTAEQILDKLLGGTSGNDVISGFRGNDSISGGAGDDLLYGHHGSDTIDGGAGNDLLVGESFFEVGSEPDHDVLIGGPGDDTLAKVGGSAVFKFEAGFGNDRISEAGDRSTIEFGSSIAAKDISCVYVNGSQIALTLARTGDSVRVVMTDSIQIRFSDGTVWSNSDVRSKVVHAATSGDDVLTGTSAADMIDALAGNDSVSAGDGADRLFGGSGNDTLLGDAGNDILSGGLGDDMLHGGLGDDRYEYAAGDGNDRIIDDSGIADALALGDGLTPAGSQVAMATSGASAGSYRISFASVGGSITMTGIESVAFRDGTVWSRSQLDELARTIAGTAGNDSLRGTAGADLLLGLPGNDQLDGLAGHDRLDGGAGIDTMRGGLGDDVYLVDNSADVVTESYGQGFDSVEASASYTLPAYVEALKLVGSAAINGTGNSLANTLTGNGGANVLSGGAGADKMTGAAGNDRYVVDNAGDSVTEAAGEGLDTVVSSISYALGANVEHLLLSGTALSGTGNAADNLLVGTAGSNKLSGAAGNDTLDGGAGRDTLVGGVGDDLYIVDRSDDSIIENINEGIDTVESALAWTLGANLENLTLTGTAAVSGTGNALNNSLLGNAAANLLNGGTGNDTLAGGKGNDTLIGGSGADSYRFAVGDGVDTIRENDPGVGVIDTVQFGGSIRSSDLRMRRSGNDLDVQLNATTDRLVIENWYLGPAWRVETFRFSDGSALLESQVQSLVSAMAGFGATAGSVSTGTTMGSQMVHHMVVNELLTPATI